MKTKSSQYQQQGDRERDLTAEVYGAEGTTMRGSLPTTNTDSKLSLRFQTAKENKITD